MKHISKWGCPESLRRYKLRPGKNFETLGREKPDIKAELRQSLLEEQGYLCGYCGSPIDQSKSIIEHIQCQSHYPQRTLDYDNMICSCHGGQNKRSKNNNYPLYCDASKKNQEIKISPLDIACESAVTFDEDGHIISLDTKKADAEQTIQVLNLNCKVLINLRKAAIAAYTSCPDETDWGAELQFIENYRDDGKYRGFCFVIEKYIKDYRMQTRGCNDI